MAYLRGLIKRVTYRTGDRFRLRCDAEGHPPRAAVEKKEGYLDGIIEPDVQALLLTKYRAEAQHGLAKLEGAAEALEARIAFVAGLLCRIGDVWEQAAPEPQDALTAAL